MKETYDLGAVNKYFKIGDIVKIRKHNRGPGESKTFVARWSAPYRVVEVKGVDLVLEHCKTGENKRVHHNECAHTVLVPEDAGIDPGTEDPDAPLPQIEAPPLVEPVPVRVGKEKAEIVAPDVGSGNEKILNKEREGMRTRSGREVRNVKNSDFDYDDEPVFLSVTPQESACFSGALSSSVRPSVSVCEPDHPPPTIADKMPTYPSARATSYDWNVTRSRMIMRVRLKGVLRSFFRRDPADAGAVSNAYKKKLTRTLKDASCDMKRSELTRELQELSNVILISPGFWITLMKKRPDFRNLPLSAIENFQWLGQDLQIDIRGTTNVQPILDWFRGMYRDKMGGEISIGRPALTSTSESSLASEYSMIRLPAFDFEFFKSRMLDISGPCASCSDGEINNQFRLGVGAGSGQVERAAVGHGSRGSHCREDSPPR